MRDLARRLGISPTTVSEAWQTLADVGRHREPAAGGGTFVLDARAARAARAATAG